MFKAVVTLDFATAAEMAAHLRKTYLADDGRPPWTLPLGSIVTVTPRDAGAAAGIGVVAEVCDKVALVRGYDVDGHPFDTYADRTQVALVEGV